jgi:5-formyltetrahydrofolate cyclo-ligase
MLSKQELRDTLFERRRSISSLQRDSAASAALRLLMDHPLFISSQQIACYLAQDNEFDCEPFITAISAAQKKCFLPILSEQKNQGLTFAAYSPNDPLSLNRYNILEPKNKTIIPCSALDLVFLPLVGFDLQGRRLGMGGGYYDRTFAFLNKEKTHKPYLIGLAYECQYVPEIPEEDHDVLLDAVLTEERMYTFPKD